METDYKKSSKNHLIVAQYILTNTYIQQRDPKLLLAIIENLFLACSSAINHILDKNKIIYDKKDFEAKLEKFMEINPSDVNQDDLKFMLKLEKIIIKHRKSPVEFTRTDTFVICSNTYEMITINSDDVRKMITDTGKFLDKTIGIKREVKQNG